MPLASEGHGFPMCRPCVLVTLLFTSLASSPLLTSSVAQSSEPAPALSEDTPAPLREPEPALEPPDDHTFPSLLPHEQTDPVMMVGELRGVVRISPDSAEARVKLAEGLYRLGDVDAALDECRIAIRLQPDHPQAHVLLGITLMAKQDSRAAAAAFQDALRLDPVSTRAHYSLAGVQYSLGNLAAAIQSYRRVLELQPSFPDARYRLALVLKLTHRYQEAMSYMEEAAIGGIPQAQYFIGNAYRSGQGVDKNPSLAIRWWMTAVSFGHQRAAESLSRLRRQALSSDQPDHRRKDALDAFRHYRDMLWADYPEVTRIDPDESLGIALLKDSRASHGVTILFNEALALSEPAVDELALLYETGLESRLVQFDRRILACLETIATDGFMPAKKTLARIYGKGVGLAPDVQKAKAALKGFSRKEIKAIMDEISAQ